MLAYLVLLAKYLQCVSFIPERPYYEEKAISHALMAELCASEGTLMTRMAESCSVRANSGAAWEGPSEEADDKCCLIRVTAPNMALGPSKQRCGSVRHGEA
jgi:hypothetical protein